ncbi:hypothetical protein [Acidovorax sp. FG27]|uniref:hypothetical protein n=1 Tax=Acidovorax sp. FG27 TaxID=3133652 RepID=UPI0030E970E3
MSSALIHMPHHTARNRSAWLSIAAFCDPEPGRDLTAHAKAIGVLASATGKRSDGDAASAQSAPDGNHGDNDLRHRPPAFGVAR